MTKKTVTLILLFTIFLSVIAMAVWGKVPEASTEVAVTNIVFYDEKGDEVTTLNDSDNKEKKITIQRQEETITYHFRVVLLPENATDLTLEYTLDTGEAEVELLVYEPQNEESTSEAPHNYYDYKITFQKQSVTILSFVSNFSSTRRIKDYLMFAFEGDGFSDDIII